MVPFTWRGSLGSTYNYSVYGSQKSWIFHEHTNFELKTSKVEYIIVSIWFCDHLLSMQPSRKTWCSLAAILFGTKKWWSNFGPTKVYCLETNQLSTQSFSNVFLWECIISKGGSRGITRQSICWKHQETFMYQWSQWWIWIKDGLLYFKGLLYISLGPIWLKIIQMRHNLSTARHFGFNKTMKFILQDF